MEEDNAPKKEERLEVPPEVAKSTLAPVLGAFIFTLFAAIPEEKRAQRPDVFEAVTPLMVLREMLLEEYQGIFDDVIKEFNFELAKIITEGSKN